MRDYSDYINYSRKIYDVYMSMSVLNWDMETHMPKNGNKFRAQQLSTLAKIAYDLETDNKYGKLLEKLLADNFLNNDQKRNVYLSNKQFLKRKRYSGEFIQRQSNLISKSFKDWRIAKEKNDFNLFRESLEEIVNLRKEESELLGYSNHPYDALLDKYEPNLTTKDVDLIFDDVKNHLVPFISKITQSNHIDDSFFYQHFDQRKQWDFGIELLKQMGYNFDSGRQDISAHPFSSHFSPEDARVTTRIDENNLSDMIWSCIHEGGHALYEQGILSENYGTPLGNSISLGIHESQSRLWENHVGRSLPYWKNNFRRLQSFFPNKLKNISYKIFYEACNNVKSSLIRTNSDELTYHLHVLIRYEIERGLIEGNIEVDELPSKWNSLYKKYLDIDVPSDSMGVLQDIHWSHGSFGYFPTYTIGSFYAAQFYMQASSEISNIDIKMENGDTKELLNWLRENIHKQGERYDAKDLCKKITGEELNFKYFMNYAKNKYSKIYDIK